MSVLTIRTLVDGGYGPRQMTSETLHYGDIPTLEALMDETDDWAWGSHFFDIDENVLEMFIS